MKSLFFAVYCFGSSFGCQIETHEFNSYAECAQFSKSVIDTYKDRAEEYLGAWTYHISCSPILEDK